MVSLLAIGRVIRRDWRVPIVLAVLGAGVAISRDVIVAPTYRAEAVVAVVNDTTGTGESGTGSLSALASLAGVTVAGGESKRAEYLAILQSRRTITEFIRRKNLMPVLFASRWDAKSGNWRPSSRWRRSPTDVDAVEYFRNNILTIVDDKKTGLVTVKIDWHDPVLVADWANGIVALLNEETRRSAADEGRKSIDYLNQELARTTISEVRQTIGRLLESRLDKVMIANVQDQYALRTVDPALPADPTRPLKPRPVLDLLVAAIFGMSLGLATAIWRRRELWRPA